MSSSTVRLAFLCGKVSSCENGERTTIQQLKYVYDKQTFLCYFCYKYFDIYHSYYYKTLSTRLLLIKPHTHMHIEAHIVTPCWLLSKQNIQLTHFRLVGNPAVCLILFMQTMLKATASTFQYKHCLFPVVINVIIVW